MSGGSNVASPNASPPFSAWAGGNGTDQVMADGMARASTRSVIVVDSRGRIYWQDAATGKTLKTVAGPADLDFGEASLQSAAVSSSAGLVAMIDNGAARVIDPADGHTVSRIPGSTSSWVTFSGSHLLVQRKDGSLEIWNARGTALDRTLPAELVYGPPVGNEQGTLIARPQANGSIELDDQDSGTVVDTIPPVSTASWAKPGVAFTPDGDDLIIVASGVGSAADSAELIDVAISGRALTDAACAAAGGALSPSEWRAFVGGDLPADLACRKKGS
jgi:WD40 repeat protein